MQTEAVFYMLKGAESNTIKLFPHIFPLAVYELFFLDESWKVGREGEVGAYWGLWDKNEKLKF